MIDPFARIPLGDDDEELIVWFDECLDSVEASHPDRVKAYKEWIQNLEDPAMGVTPPANVPKHRAFVKRLRGRIEDLNKKAGV